ncbi:hypothetical protein [Xenorhabdus bharatensis]|uniref:hypothetical protein n=1 Tax=Xenorhabdus bharatensis TaxID=3136256 RepID=UPI0030F4760A
MAMKNNQLRAPYLPQSYNNTIDEEKSDQHELVIKIYQYDDVHIDDKIIVHLNEYISSPPYSITCDNINYPVYQITIPFYTIPLGEYDIFYTIINRKGYPANSATNRVTITKSTPVSPVVKGTYILTNGATIIDAVSWWETYPISSETGVGKQLNTGVWSKEYGDDKDPSFSFVEGEKTYYFGYTDVSLNGWYIQQISAQGPTGPILAQGKWVYRSAPGTDYSYSYQMLPFIIERQTYGLVFNEIDTPDGFEKHWYIHQISSNGINPVLVSGKCSECQFNDCTFHTYITSFVEG